MKARKFHEVDLYNFGRWLAYVLDVEGMSQSRLAHSLKLNENTVCGYVAGTHMPRLTTLWRICVYLDVPFGDAIKAIEMDLRVMENVTD